MCNQSQLIKQSNLSTRTTSGPYDFTGKFKPELHKVKRTEEEGTASNSFFNGQHNPDTKT